MDGGVLMTEGKLPHRIWRRFLAIWFALAVVGVFLAAVIWIDGGAPWWIAAIFTVVAALMVAYVVVWRRVPHD